MEKLIKDTTKFLRLLVEYHIPGTALKGVRNVIVADESEAEKKLKEGILLDHTKAPVENLVFKIVREIAAPVKEISLQRTVSVSAAPCSNC